MAEPLSLVSAFFSVGGSFLHGRMRKWWKNRNNREEITKIIDEVCKGTSLENFNGLLKRLGFTQKRFKEEFRKKLAEETHSLASWDSSIQHLISFFKDLNCIIPAVGNGEGSEKVLMEKSEQETLVKVTEQIEIYLRSLRPDEIAAKISIDLRGQAEIL